MASKDKTKIILALIIALIISQEATALTTIYTNTTKITGSAFGNTFLTSFNGSGKSYIEYNITWELPLAGTGLKLHYDSNASTQGDENVFFDWDIGSLTYTGKNEPGYGSSIASIAPGKANISYQVNYSAGSAKFCYAGSCSSSFSFGADGIPTLGIEWGATGAVSNITRITAAILDSEVPDTTAPNYDVVNDTITNISARIFSNASETSNLTINYGTTTNLGTILTNLTNATNLSIFITGLSPNTIIYYNTTRCDNAGNCANKGGYSFTTATNPVMAACNATIKAKLIIENPRPYNDKGSTFTFAAYYTDQQGNPVQGNHTRVYITFNDTEANMTNMTTKWTVSITSNQTEDVPIVVHAENDYASCLTVGFTTRFRTPFFIDFQLYKEPLNGTEPARYANEFQYVVLVDNAAKNTDDLFTTGLDSATNKLWDNTLGWATGTSVSNVAKPIDKNIYFWGAYTIGSARVKIYEPGNYSVYVMNNKVTYPINYFWEFERPTTQDIEYMGIVYENLHIYNETNITNTPAGWNLTTYKISFSKFEANTYYAFMNIFTIIIVAIIYFGLLGLIIYTFNNSQNIDKILIAYFVIATPIALGFVFYIR